MWGDCDQIPIDTLINPTPVDINPEHEFRPVDEALSQQCRMVVDLVIPPRKENRSGEPELSDCWQSPAID